MAQALDSLGYMKKMLITNKVTTHFFITPFKSIPSTLHALPTAFSRIKKEHAPVFFLGMRETRPGTSCYSKKVPDTFFTFT